MNPTIPNLAVARVSAPGFVQALAAFRAARPDLSKYVSYPEDSRVACYLTGDDQSGFTVSPGGYLGSLFSAVPGRGPDLVALAIQLGATSLDCFDGYLPTLYRACGFVEAHRVPFDPLLAPPGFDDQPSVIYMVLK